MPPLPLHPHLLLPPDGKAGAWAAILDHEVEVKC